MKKKAWAAEERGTLIFIPATSVGKESYGRTGPASFVTLNVHQVGSFGAPNHEHRFLRRPRTLVTMPLLFRNNSRITVRPPGENSIGTMAGRDLWRESHNGERIASFGRSASTGNYHDHSFSFIPLAFSFSHPFPSLLLGLPSLRRFLWQSIIGDSARFRERWLTEKDRLSYRERGSFLFRLDSRYCRPSVVSSLFHRSVSFSWRNRYWNYLRSIKWIVVDVDRLRSGNKW